MSMETVTWLHLSDLHFRATKEPAWDRNIVLKGLLNDLRGLKETNDLSPDLIMISGDIAYSGKE